MPTYTAPTLPINTEEKFQQGIDFITNATPSTTNPPIKKGLIASMLDYAKKTNKIPDYTPGETLNKDEVRYYELGDAPTLKSNWEEVDLSDYKVIQCEQLEEGGRLYTTEEILSTDDKLILVYNIIGSSYNYGRIINNNSNAYEVGIDINTVILGIGTTVELLNIPEMSLEAFVHDFGSCEDFITNVDNERNYFYYQGKYLKLLSCPYSQEPYETSTAIKGIWRSEIDETTEAPSDTSVNWKLLADLTDTSDLTPKVYVDSLHDYSIDEIQVGRFIYINDNGDKVYVPKYRKLITHDLSSTNSTNEYIDVSELNAKRMFIRGFLESSNKENFYAINTAYTVYSQPENSSLILESGLFQLRFNLPDNAINIDNKLQQVDITNNNIISTGKFYEDGTLYLILEYTKTTDTEK